MSLNGQLPSMTWMILPSSKSSARNTKSSWITFALPIIRICLPLFLDTKDPKSMAWKIWRKGAAIASIRFPPDHRELERRTTVQLQVAATELKETAENLDGAPDKTEERRK